MITELSLENVVLFDQLQLRFEKAGLTVLTGETGAGKSLVLEAISWGLGTKVSAKNVLKAGTDRARIEVTLAIPEALNEPVAACLKQAEITWQAEDGLNCYREFTATTSRCRINGTPVSREVLEQLGTLLLQNAAQHGLMQLSQPGFQLACLDNCPLDEGLHTTLKTQKQAVKSHYIEWQALQAQLETARNQHAQAQQQEDWLRFQTQELLAAQLLDPEEDSRCREQLQALQHAESLLQAAQSAQAIFSGEASKNSIERTNNIEALLSQAQRPLSKVSAHDPRLAALSEKIDGLQIEAQELSHLLADYIAQIESASFQDNQAEQTQTRVQTLVERLDLLEKLKRKYGKNGEHGGSQNTLAKVITLRDDSLQQLALLEAGVETFEALETETQQAQHAFEETAQRLSETRKAMAPVLTSALAEKLQALALPHAALEIAFEPAPPSMEGLDRVTLLFTANPGQPLKPLAQVASGGELARVFLALMVLSQNDSGPKTFLPKTFLLDEVDAGMSGLASRALAEELLTLAQRHQVLAITHQALVAARGTQHLHLVKTLLSGLTRIQAQDITQDETTRVSVLGQLASGLAADVTTQQFASRLLAG